MINYLLDKWVWTEGDFDRMGWHDARIHALATLPDSFEFMLDLDYIFEWVHPAAGEKYFRFWVAPATLVFENVYALVLDLVGDGQFEIDGITREVLQRPRNADLINREQEWQWVIACQQGEIRLRAAGYKQFIRTAPRLSDSQVLDINERGGISFTRSHGDA